MEAYQTLMDDLDAQIEGALGLFKKKVGQALDVPEREEEEETRTSLYGTVHGLGPSKPEDEPPSFLQKAASKLSTAASTFSNAASWITNTVAPPPEKTTNPHLNTPRKTVTLTPELQTFEQQGNELIEKGKAEEYLGELDKLTKRGGTRRKRKGPTGNRTRIAGFKVLSAKPLHHKTKK